MDTHRLANEHGVSLENDPMVGTSIGGRYRLLSKLGSGKVSSVYKACDVSQVKTVAIKFLEMGPQANPDKLKLFEHNARLNIVHPNLIAVHACGLADDGRPWLALEYLEGRTLADLLRAEGHLTVEQTLVIFEQLFESLSYVHGQSELHMNIKPSSIFLLGDESRYYVKLADVGVTKLILERELDSADVHGRPPVSAFYMSPEQFKGDSFDAQSDVYSLGCLLYHCLYGRPPHEGTDLLQTMDMHLHAEPAFPSEPEMSETLQAVLRKALSKETFRRQRSVVDLSKEIAAALNGKFPEVEEEPVYAPVTSNSYRPPVGRRPPAKKGNEPWVLLLTCVTFLLIVVMIQQSINIVRELH